MLNLVNENVIVYAVCCANTRYTRWAHMNIVQVFKSIVGFHSQFLFSQTNCLVDLLDSVISLRFFLFYYLKIKRIQKCDKMMCSSQMTCLFSGLFINVRHDRKRRKKTKRFWLYPIVQEMKLPISFPLTNRKSGLI